MQSLFFFFFFFFFNSLTQIFLHCDVVDGHAVITKNITVDKSGHGDFMTIQEAINSVPDGNNQWIRIHVVQGVYREKAFIPSQKEYVLLEGEGHQQTAIEWDEPASMQVKGTRGATFSILANNFVIRDIAFKNTYDRVKYGSQQALAVFVRGDKGSFHRCAFFAYQDTLCDFIGRHYYHNCWIEGAVDFVYGFGQSIFENSTLHSIKEGPIPGWLTAHGKVKPDVPGGFVFKYCTVDGGKTYLGRAWNSYSTVVFYNTYMADNVVPEGWAAWETRDKGTQTTYAEDGCNGPGSDATRRVTWEKKLGPQELESFTNIKFIDQESWLSRQPR